MSLGKDSEVDSSNPKLTYIGGSKFDAWNRTLANRALRLDGPAIIRMQTAHTNCNPRPQLSRLRRVKGRTTGNVAAQLPIMRQWNVIGAQ
jgi:hypothetical protein